MEKQKGQAFGIGNCCCGQMVARVPVSQCSSTADRRRPLGSYAVICGRSETRERQASIWMTIGWQMNSIIYSPVGTSVTTISWKKSFLCKCQFNSFRPANDFSFVEYIKFKIQLEVRINGQDDPANNRKQHLLFIRWGGRQSQALNYAQVH